MHGPSPRQAQSAPGNRVPAAPDPTSDQTSAPPRRRGTPPGFLSEVAM
jgi:hypothetical protein